MKILLLLIFVCHFCTAASTIADCARESVSDKGQAVCEKCSEGFYPNTNSSACLRCPRGCKACSNGSFCSTCNDGYYWWFGPDCNKCLANCRSCSNSMACHQCNDGFEKATSSISIERCQEIVKPMNPVFLAVMAVVCLLGGLCAAFTSFFCSSRKPVDEHRRDPSIDNLSTV